jgi:hypothetical protein
MMGEQRKERCAKIEEWSASIHLRALLTDLFLIDGIVRGETVGSVPLVE